MRFPRINGIILASLLLLALTVACGGTKKLQTVSAWFDGTYNPDTSQIGYGTHDWVAEHAIDLLPSNESGWLTSNKRVFLLGTEAPENASVEFEGARGYGDIQNHHNYYNGTFPKDCTDDSASIRAQEEYQKALLCLGNGSYELAAWYAGAMTHYISDTGAWSHVISNPTLAHALRYEELLNYVTDEYSKEPGYMSAKPDNEALSAETAYNAALWLGIGTYSDGGGWHNRGPFPASAMNQQFQDNWSSVSDMPQMYRMRIGYSLSATVLAVADTLHALTLESGLMSSKKLQILATEAATLLFAGALFAAVTVLGYRRFRKKNTQSTENAQMLVLLHFLD